MAPLVPALNVDHLHVELRLDLLARDELGPVLLPPHDPLAPELEGQLHVQLPRQQEAPDDAFGAVPVLFWYFVRQDGWLGAGSTQSHF